MDCVYSNQNVMKQTIGRANESQYVQFLLFCVCHSYYQIIIRKVSYIPS